VHRDLLILVHNLWQRWLFSPAFAGDLLLYRK
jgi:hypothetical protein